MRAVSRFWVVFNLGACEAILPTPSQTDLPMTAFYRGFNFSYTQIPQMIGSMWTAPLVPTSSSCLLQEAVRKDRKLGSVGSAPIPLLP